jgi:hypothetical protein
MHNKETREEAVRLRVQERLSMDEILNRLPVNVGRGTLSGWLREYPLTVDEYRLRKLGNLPSPVRKDRGEESRWHKLVAGKQLSRHQKAKIAEAAVLFRLVLHGFAPFGSVFDGDIADWLVQVPETGRSVTIQVRWVKQGRHGLPMVSLRRTEGHNTEVRFKAGEFDYIVGYDLFTDTAYVFSFQDVAHLRQRVTISEQYAEAWDKLRSE